MRIFSLEGNKPLAREVADRVGIELGRCSVKRFNDGEVQINTEEGICGYDVFIIQPTSHPVNLHLMELLIMIDVCKHASAANINTVIPYYGRARQSRKVHSREPITAKLVANLIGTAGANRTTALDLHTSQTQGFFDIPVDHLMGILIIGQHSENDPNVNPEECVIVSPDYGEVARARRLADILKTPITIIGRRRPKPNVAEVMDIVGEIEGRIATIIDDTIDTAGTTTLATQALKDKGTRDVYACCTHPVLSGPTEEHIGNSTIKEFTATNSILPDDSQKPPNIKELPVADLIARAIVHVYERGSVNVLFD